MYQLRLMTRNGATVSVKQAETSYRACRRAVQYIDNDLCDLVVILFHDGHTFQELMRVSPHDAA